MKVCRKCGQAKAEEDYAKSTNIKSGRVATCKVCIAAKARKVYAATPIEIKRLTYAADAERAKNYRVTRYHCVIKIKNICKAVSKGYYPEHIAMRFNMSFESFTELCKTHGIDLSYTPTCTYRERNYPIPQKYRGSSV